jgi:hypothetical protein
MNSRPPSLALAAHLMLLSSISFGGFPSVLPDVHKLATANGWLTDREFADIFAVSQVVPGPNMILVMSFAGLKVGGLPGAITSAVATFGPPCLLYLRRIPPVGPVPRQAVAAGRAPQPCPVDDRARHCRRLCDGTCWGCRVAGHTGDGGCSGAEACDTPQSALDSGDRRSLGRPRFPVTLCEAPHAPQATDADVIGKRRY